MKALFDYGEFLICIAPVFLIIWAVGLALLWNSLPSRKKEKEIGADGTTESHDVSEKTM